MKRLLSAVLIFVLVFSFSIQAFAATTKPYSDNKLGWSVTLPAGYAKASTDTKSNEANFKDKSGKSAVSVYMYSKGSYTLDSWVNSELNEIKTNYNSTYVKVLKTEAVKVNKVAAKKIYTKLVTGSTAIVQCNLYLIGKNYRYVVSYAIPSADYDNAAKKGIVETAIGSFKFSEPNAATVGTLKEVSNAIDSAKKLKVENKETGWALEIPDTWKKISDLAILTSYQVNNFEMSVMVSALPNTGNKTMEQCAKDYAAQLVTEKTNKITSQKATTLNGYDATLFNVTGAADKTKAYVILANDYIYHISVITANTVDLPKNVKVADSIFNSLKLTDNSLNVEGNSIKDYAALLKGTTKNKIGDSYYKWSFAAPKSLLVDTRSFNGEATYFATGDEKCMFLVLTYKNDDNLSLDAISAQMLSNAKDKYTILVSEKRTKGNQEYAVLTYRGDKDKFVNEHRTFLVGDRIYLVALSVEEEDYNKGTYASVIDSFDTTFITDGTVEDLSDVNKDGYRTYKNRKLKWSIDALPEWADAKAENKDNSISFFINDYSNTYVEMYSKETGLTLDSWAKSEYDDLNKKFNKQLVQIAMPQDVVIGGVPAKRIDVTAKTNYDTFHDSYFYIVGKNYRYELGYSLDDKTFKDPALLAKIEKTMKSFTYTEPDAKVVGKLLDPDTLNTMDATKTITSKEYNWTAKLPVTFIANEGSNDEDYASYSCSSSLVNFDVYVDQAVGNVEEYGAGFDYDVQQNPTKYTMVSKETIYTKDTSVKKYIYRYASSNKVNAYYNIEYILVKNGYVYTIYLSCRDIRYTDYATGIMNTIWESMTF